MMKNERRNRPKTPYSQGKSAHSGTPGEGWLWGRHAVLAAIANPRRKQLRLVVTRNAERELPEDLKHETADPAAIDRLLPPGAVHQGFALQTEEPVSEPLRSVVDPTHGLVLVLDQVTDPHNAGAILRSAAAFGVRAVVMQDRKSPPLLGAVAKAAVGAAETVPVIRVTNIADSVLEMREAGRFAVGLAGEADGDLHDIVAKHGGPGLVIVMGSEDKGLRPRVAESCDILARIPMTAKAESLNVSVAAAVALYEAHRARITKASA